MVMMMIKMMPITNKDIGDDCAIVHYGMLRHILAHFHVKKEKKLKPLMQYPVFYERITSLR